MTIPRLNPRDARALAVGVIALGLLIGVPRGSRAWLAWRTESIQAALEMTREMERTTTTVAGVATALDSAEARVARFRDAGTAVFVVRKPAEAAAGLAAAIREAAGASSIRVVAVESRLDSTNVNTLRHVSATAHANGDVAGLATLLQRLETGSPLLALRKLSVQPQSVETPQDAAEMLDIRFTIEALVLIAEQRRP
jgi:general secretion pathway protein M